VRRDRWRGVEQELEDVAFREDILLIWDTLRRICRAVDRQPGITLSFRDAYAASLEAHNQSTTKIAPRILTDGDALEWFNFVRHPSENDGSKDLLAEVRMALNIETNIVKRCAEILGQDDKSSLTERLDLVSGQLPQRGRWFAFPPQAVKAILRNSKSRMSESDFNIAREILTARHK